MSAPTKLAASIVSAGWSSLLLDNVGALPPLPARAYVTALAALSTATVGYWHYRARRGPWSLAAYRAGMRAGRVQQAAHRIAEQRRARGLTADTTG